MYIHYYVRIEMYEQMLKGIACKGLHHIDPDY